MAMNVKGLLRNSLKFLTTSIPKPNFGNATRPLYSAASLAIDRYSEARRRIANQFQSVSQTFRAKMQEFTDQDNKSIIFTEDLKAMLHIVDNNKEDIELMMKMIKKFHAQNNELRFGNYIFGPVVMRALYYLDLPDVALEAFKDHALQGFFDQHTSYKVLLTLLFNHQRYSEMRNIYDIIQQKFTSVTYPYDCIILVLASCYKENTPESFQFALELWKNFQEKGIEPNRKAICLISTLALKQGKPDFALELISACSKRRHIDVRCIKIETYTELNRLDDVTQLMKNILHSEKVDNESNKPTYFFKDTIEKLEEALKKAGPEDQTELVRIIEELRHQNLIQDKTLDDSLSRVIERRHLEEKVDSGSAMNRNRNEYRKNRGQKLGLIL